MLVKYSLKNDSIIVMKQKVCDAMTTDTEHLVFQRKYCMC